MSFNKTGFSRKHSQRTFPCYQMPGRFKFPYFQDNLNMMIVIGAIYGVVRTIGAIGLLKNKMWGFMLSVINCVITMALMMFLLPAGILDGVLASSALILMLTQYYGNKEISGN